MILVETKKKKKKDRPIGNRTKNSESFISFSKLIFSNELITMKIYKFLRHITEYEYKCNKRGCIFYGLFDLEG